MILAVECYIISFNSFDPFTFIFPFIKSFLFFGLGGGVHFWPSHKLGGKFWIWGFFGGVKGVALVISLSWLKNHRSPSSPLSHKSVQSIEIRYDTATLFHNNKNPFSNFLFIIGIWWVFWGMFKFISYMFRAQQKKYILVRCEIVRARIWFVWVNWTLILCVIGRVTYLTYLLLMLNAISRELSSYVGFQDFHLCFSVGKFGRLCLALHCTLYPYI